jgi:hypothetical protein
MNTTGDHAAGYRQGYEQADRDNTHARVALCEAISEAQIARADAHRDKDYRSARFWKQKADRWQANLDATTAARTRHTRTKEKRPTKREGAVLSTERRRR